MSHLLYVEMPSLYSGLAFMSHLLYANIFLREARGRWARELPRLSSLASALSARSGQGAEWRQSLMIVADMALGREYWVVAKSVNFGASLSGWKILALPLVSRSSDFSGSPFPHV